MVIVVNILLNGVNTASPASLWSSSPSSWERWSSWRLPGAFSSGHVSSALHNRMKTNVTDINPFGAETGIARY